ncbi:PREDICTED: uncharacterized protein LOC107340778 isoform X1 [Acropora digitifera]|uniref:uncharacterized protein LOC114974171 n=1 Tax=Acropora millepora TaxID=45264 RepID=UPI00077A1014|nr:PREDICTED: uncharacterized protein LOC107340778 isoform X1 [Acropora digitifera]XP_029210315.2 uncharacterized protein LOC114974171 [Acropora millepora]
MGSSFSILNDTKHNVWITHGINWEVLTASVQGVSILLTAGMAVAGASAEKNSTQVAGMTATQWTKAEKITNLAVAALSEPLGKAREEAKKVQDDDIEFKAHAELKKPGEKYTFSGTLSLTMTVYVMNDMQQHDKRACVTGPTVDSENIYPISQYFTNLDVI